MIEQERAFKGIWIPKEIWLSKDLTLQEKVFIVEIDSLDNDNGCFASNNYFADFFGITASRASQIITSLKQKGFLNVELEREGRQITRRILKINRPPYPYLENYIGIKFSKEGIEYSKEGIKNPKRGYLGNCEDNNIDINNPFNNTNNNNSYGDKSPKPDRPKIDFDKIKEYFNTYCTGFSAIREMTESRKKTIKSFLKNHSESDLYMLFDTAQKSDFLTGNNTNGWTASFDWIIKPANAVKILEGNYNNRAKKEEDNIPETVRGIYQFMKEEEAGNGIETIF